MMMSVEKTSCNLLLACVIILPGNGALLGVIEYTSYESLFIPPADFNNSSVNTLTDLTNLENLRKACLFWAENNDSKSQLIDEILLQFNSLLNAMIVSIMFLTILFGCGFSSIYTKQRRFRIENKIIL
jgi:hypothetical protein